MSSLTDLPELVGFFSYSREDDADSQGALSALRSRIQGELRGQLGRTAKTFRLWQDKEAIASGTLWESEIKNAVGQAVFFIPIITPTVVASTFCRFELDAFLAREAALGRSDLVFPILYIHVPALEDSVRRQNDPVLSLIAKRQYADWREFRHLDSNSTEVKRFCGHIRDALNKPWLSPQEQKQREQAAALAKAEEEREREMAQSERRAAEEARQRTAEQERQRREAEAERNRIAAVEVSAREEEARRRRQAAAERQIEAEQQKTEPQQPTAVKGAPPSKESKEKQYAGADEPRPSDQKWQSEVSPVVIETAAEEIGGITQADVPGYNRNQSVAILRAIIGTVLVLALPMYILIGSSASQYNPIVHYRLSRDTLRIFENVVSISLLADIAIGLIIAFRLQRLFSLALLASLLEVVVCAFCLYAIAPSNAGGILSFTVKLGTAGATNHWDAAYIYLAYYGTYAIVNLLAALVSGGAVLATKKK